jgi:hypothetical protein
VTLDGVSTKDGDILVGVDTSINSVEISAGGEGGEGGDFLDNFWGSLIDAALEEDGDESGEGDDEDDEALNDE